MRFHEELIACCMVFVSRDYIAPYKNNKGLKNKAQRTVLNLAWLLFLITLAWAKSRSRDIAQHSTYSTLGCSFASKGTSAELIWRRLYARVLNPRPKFRCNELSMLREILRTQVNYGEASEVEPSDFEFLKVRPPGGRAVNRRVLRKIQAIENYFADHGTLAGQLNVEFSGSPCAEYQEFSNGRGDFVDTVQFLRSDNEAFPIFQVPAGG